MTVKVLDPIQVRRDKKGRGDLVRLTAFLLATSVVFVPSESRAGGYAIGQESVSSMGTAHSGGAAAATDPSTVWYNPAGMTKIDGRQLMVGGMAIFPFITYEEEGSTLFNGNAYNGGEGGDGGQNALVPHIYGVHTLDNGLKLGLGVNSPFGLVTDYEQGWKGRYSEVTTSLKSFNVNGAIAGQVARGLSLGAGVSGQYIRGTLTQAIDFGSNCAAALGATACNNNFGLVPGQSDGSGKVTADAIGFGFNVGALYEVNESTRFGAHYRSRMNFQFEGRGDFAVSTGARNFLTAAGLPNAFTPTNAEFVLVEPEMASISAYHDIDDKWAIMGDITWTRWGSFPQLMIEFDNQTPTNTLQTDWHNVFRYAVGTTYKWSRDMTLRGGLAFDDSPIDTGFRGPGIPDSDRIVLGVGLGYKISDTLHMDVGYQHLFFKTGKTERLSATNSVLNGDFNVNVDVFGLAFTWKL